MAEKLRLADLVPGATLERLRWGFKVVTGVPMVFTDDEGTALTDLEEPLRYCGALVRCPQGGTLCLRRKRWHVPEPEGDAAVRRTQHDGKPISHQCAGRFRDMAVPIVIEGQTVGFAVFARTLTEEPDLARFRALASEHGMAPEVGEKVARSALVMPEGKLSQVAGFLQTIAELVVSAAYDTLRARQVLELEELRDSLVHMIVHDLRTPLTSIMGSLQVIQESEYDADLTHELVPMALSSSETLLELINMLLDINKMESGELQLDVAPVDFAQVAQAAVDQVRGLATEQGQELVLTVAPDCPVVQADGELVRRVVVNLLGNAIKFTQAGGRIELSAHGEDGGLVFSVSDNGPGIPEEDQARIFEKFGQAAAHKKRRKYSTGLGLAFCKMVAEAHGGRVWLESAVGRGSSFSVFLPPAPRAG